MGTRRAVDDRPRSRRPALCQDLDLSAGARSPSSMRPAARLTFAPRHRPSRPRLGQRRTGLDSRRRPRLELPARRDRRARRTPRAPSGFRCSLRGEVLGVMEFFSRDIRAARRGPAVDADDGRQPDRHVHRSVARAGGTRPLLHAVARHVPGRRVRRRTSNASIQRGIESSATPRPSCCRGPIWISSTPTIARPRWRRRQGSRPGKNSSTSRIATGTRTGRCAG